MKHGALEQVIALVSGIAFGVGLAVSGMTRPQKVIGFLDVTGDWDASLLFVMMSAVAVHFLAYRLVERRRAPICGESFRISSRRDVDRKLLFGAAVFGVGWGLGGYCPGPGVVSLGAGAASALVFVATMLLGMFVTAKLEAATNQPRRGAPADDAGAS